MRFSGKGTKGFLTIVVLATVSAPKATWAWGHRGHQTIATVGSTLMNSSNPFWAANATSMGVLTNVPDQVWKSGPSAELEKPNHWFQPDSYFSNPDQFDRFPHLYVDAVKQYGEDSISLNGTAPWRVQQLYDMALSALKSGDLKTGLQMAGVMSHYIGDMSQPLHVTKNYDGAETHDPGIHKYFETDNLEKADANRLTADVTTRTQALLKDSDFTDQFSGSITDIIFKEIDRSYPFKDKLIDIDVSEGRGTEGSAQMLAMAKSRLADGAATLTLILQRLSHEASLGSSGATIKVGTPKWVSSDFGNSVAPAAVPVVRMSTLVPDPSIDDCDLPPTP